MNKTNESRSNGEVRKESKLESLASLCTVFAIALFVMTFVFQNFVIPTSSMASTLMVGDHVVVERANLAPAADWAPFAHYREVRRGDIIVFFKPPAEPNGEHIPLVKRVIGVPGDRIRLQNGVVYLNGVAQVEPLAAKPRLQDICRTPESFHRCRLPSDSTLQRSGR